MIRRAPKPTKDFQLLRNSVARDVRLSYRASGILADLLSRPDNWTTSAERLAEARPEKEGRDAVRKALRELEQAGYLRREKVRDELCRWSTELIVYDIPQSDITAGGTEDGTSAVGESGTGNQSSENQALKEDLQEDVKEDVLSCAAPRFARPPEDDGNEGRSFTAEAEDWRAEDRARFAEILGEKWIYSYGHKGWVEGTHAAHHYYDAFRMLKRKPIKWPGRFLESLEDASPLSGVDNWLMDHGLERSSTPPRAG